MKPRIATEESYLLYQNLCDNVFGVGVVKIKPASSNNIIGTLNYLDDYTENQGDRNFYTRFYVPEKCV